MKKVSALLVLTLSFFCLGCQHQKKQVSKPEASKGLTIVTSFYPLYAITNELAGDVNQVQMLGSNSGIHGFDPSVKDVQRLHDADLFIYHSHILESWAKDVSKTIKGSSVVSLEAAKGLPLIRVKGLEDMPVAEGMDADRLNDPHSWLDPRLVAKEAEHISQTLQRLDPKHKQLYRKRTQHFKEKADRLDKDLQKRFAKAKQKVFVTQHTAFSYVANRYGLEQLGIAGVAEEEPGPRKLKEIKEFVDTYHVKTIFFEKNVSSKLAKTLADESHITTKRLDPLETPPKGKGDYLDHLGKNLRHLADALAD